ncbi:SAVED domain-containing protein [Pectobacterium sp. CHL-2024]|uniref:SAVED domain-containing protein n=1 Tax=Pectobacterium sp. CHL-2024 TaxID=3377079 RepID=UPI0038178779
MNENELLNQTNYPPLEDDFSINELLSFIESKIVWDCVDVISDEGSSNIIITTSDNGIVKSCFRLNLPPREFEEVIKKISCNKKLILSYLQGVKLSSQDLSTLESIQGIYIRTRGQSREVDLPTLTEFLLAVETGSRDKGRGKDFTAETKRIVNMASHSRCMFIGCGEYLNIDELTGQEGNYSYLAHNVASSENGERGIPVLSNLLSNEPSNILLLCDKHHRLIDRVAACDYTAEILSNMRNNFIRDADELLDGLRYQPIPVYSILWPINTNVASPPNKKEISASLSILNLKMSGAINSIYDSNDSTREAPESHKYIMPSSIKTAADKIIQQTRDSGHRAALFAFGPTPALVALGALLGNKSQYTPMLRYREGACWKWPSSTATGMFYDRDGFEELELSEEVIICIAFTAFPEAMMAKANNLSETLGAKIVTYKPKNDAFDNGAIPHPTDGVLFSSKLHYDFHTLKSRYGVKKMHILICASNAASVFIGQAFDLHHPEMVVYDFKEGSMQPILSLINDSSRTNISYY